MHYFFALCLRATDTVCRRAELIRGLYNALSSHGLTDRVGILADEANTLDKATSEYNDWLPQVIDQVRGPSREVPHEGSPNIRLRPSFTTHTTSLRIRHILHMLPRSSSATPGRRRGKAYVY